MFVHCLHTIFEMGYTRGDVEMELLAFGLSIFRHYVWPVVDFGWVADARAPWLEAHPDPSGRLTDAGGRFGGFFLVLIAFIFLWSCGTVRLAF